MSTILQNVQLGLFHLKDKGVGLFLGLLIMDTPKSECKQFNLQKYNVRGRGAVGRASDS